MPKELEPLYSRLLDLIEPQYLSWASKAFQILRNAHKLSEYPFGKSSAAKQGVSPLTVKAFFFAIKENFAIQNFTLEEFGTRCEDIEVQLAARCAGLLEISHVRDGSRSKTIGPNSLIQYFHRTTRDFLEKDQHWSRLLLQTKVDFNPNTAMMRSCLVSIQFNLQTAIQAGQPLAKDFLIYSYHADTYTESQIAQITLLDQMNDIMTARMPWSTVDLFPESIGIRDLLPLATEYGLQAYVTAKVTQKGKSQQKECATELLRFLLKEKDYDISNKQPTPKIEMVSRLLDLRGRSKWKRRFSNSMGKSS
jgi:hypothetical protein